MSDYSNPAFPVDASATEEKCLYMGMSLRDYFAAKAMPIYLVNPESTIESDAKNAYRMADAMLAAREAK